jgi:purine-binding chemotaxis protein CheW
VNQDAGGEGPERAPLKLAVFGIDKVIFGVDILRVKEVVQAVPHPIRPTPRMPEIVSGIIEVRGAVMPVVDLRLRFGMGVREAIDKKNKFVIVVVASRIVALLVDYVIGEARVPSSLLRPPPALLDEDDAPTFFSAVCQIDGEVVFLVDLDRTLDPRIRPRSAPERRS